MSKITGQLTALGVSPAIAMDGDFNIALSGTFVATMQLERTFDGDSSEAVWLACSQSPDGTAAAYSAPLSATVREPEGGVLYRWRCTAFTSGIIKYRISK